MPHARFEQRSRTAERPAERILEGCVANSLEAHNEKGRAPSGRPTCVVGWSSETDDLCRLPALYGLTNPMGK